MKKGKVLKEDLYLFIYVVKELNHYGLFPVWAN